jgi:serine protease Do
MKFVSPHHARSCSPTRAMVALIVLGAIGSTTAGLLAAAPATSEKSISRATDLSVAFRAAAREVAPSVVHIVSIARVEPADTRGGAEDLFRQFFFRPDVPGELQSPFRWGPSDPSFQPERRGEASGVVVSEDGYIVTNNHVVAGAEELQVRLEDGRELNADIVGTDPDSDLAVVKIDAHGLTPAHLGDSAAIETGDWVIAVGDPFGLDHTVTAGIISAKGRGDMGLATFENFIQTDAAINPGNSGGPIVNMNGEVVGISTAITTRTGGSMGIGFAIPSNMVRTVLHSILQYGRVERGWLGILIQPLTPDLADSFGYDGQGGALVGEVVAGGPAAETGLEAGDIIVELDGKPIKSSRDVLLIVATEPPGKDVSLDVFRNGSTRTFKVHLGERPSTEQIRSGSYQPKSPASLGMSVEALTPELAARLDLKERNGVIITRVAPSSPAADAGLRPGMVIVEVGDTPVRTEDEFNTAIADLAGSKFIRLRIVAGDSSRFIIVKPGPK